MQGIDKDEYLPGEFEVSGLTLQGNIVLNRENKTIHLYIQRRQEAFSDHCFGYQDKIIGHLTNGTTVSLLYNNCVKNTIHAFSHQEIIYRSDFLVIGNSQGEYDQLICILENALHWGKMSQLDTPQITEIKQVYCEERTFKWFGAMVEFSTVIRNNLWALPRPENCKVEERLQVKIQLEEKKDILELLEIRDRIVALISFAIKDNVNVIAQFLIDTEDCEVYGDYRESRRNELISTQPNYTIYYTDEFEYNFNLTNLSDTVDIRENMEKLAPIINLYLSLYRYPQMPIEIAFLSLIQALETLHARFFYHNDKDEYVQSVYNRFSDHPQFEYIKSILLSNGQDSPKCRQIYLVSRINDLLLDDYDPLFWSFYSKGGLFAQQIVDTRNYYTHYDEGKREKALSGNDLADGILILQLILELYVCRFLGIDVKDKIGRQLSKFRLFRVNE